MNRFIPLPVPRFEEGLLSYLDQSFQALSRVINQDAGVPVGTLEYTILTTAPEGWLFMDGVARSSNLYPELVSVIPAAWVGATTFTLPNWAGRVLVGAGTGSGLTNRVLATTGGSEALQSHDHSITMVGTVDPHVHDDGTGRIAQAGIGFIPGSATVTGTTGSGNSGNMQPWAAANIMIKH